jgi:hypothetical protein
MTEYENDTMIAPDPRELFKNATQTTVFQDVAREICNESTRYGTDPYWAGRERDWGALRHKVVGHEFE